MRRAHLAYAIATALTAPVLPGVAATAVAPSGAPSVVSSAEPSAPAPVAVWNPLVARSATPARGLGYVLQAQAADWGPASQGQVERQWMRDGRPIPGATSLTHEVTADDIGGQLALRERLTVADAPVGVVTSRAYHVKRDRSVLATRTTMRRVRGSKVVVRVRVSHRPGGESYVDGSVRPQGTVRVRLGKRRVTAPVGPGGWARVVLPAQRPGRHRIRVTHRGTPFVVKAQPVTVALVVRPTR